jgi:hypothetical protein
MFCSTAFTQAKSGVENYNLLSRDKEYVWMPVVHYQTKKGIYTEMRYNYDDLHTFSFYGGKTITGGNRIAYTITPMLGFSVGDFRSIAIASKMELSYRKLFVSAEIQYSHAFGNSQPSFFFTWPEAGIDFSEFFFAGLAAQYTIQREANYFEPGLLMGINFKNFSIPFYIFNPFCNNSYLVLGLNYEYDMKKKKMSN